MRNWLNINALSQSVLSVSFYSLYLLLTFSLYFSFSPSPLSSLCTSPSSPLTASLSPSLSFTSFCSSVCPIWTVTCLIFSRPSSPLCRALLPSPPPTVPGEVRYLHTHTLDLHIYDGTSRDADLQIRRAPTNKWNIPSGQASTCLSVHLSGRSFVFLWKPSIHPPSLSPFHQKLMLRDSSLCLVQTHTVKQVLSAGVFEHFAVFCNNKSCSHVFSRSEQLDKTGRMGKCQLRFKHASSSSPCFLVCQSWKMYLPQKNAEQQYTHARVQFAVQYILPPFLKKRVDISACNQLSQVKKT